MFKFGQEEVTAKDFYNKVVVSDKVSRNNVKDCRCFEGYQVDGVLIPLFIKTPKNNYIKGIKTFEKEFLYTAYADDTTFFFFFFTKQKFC